MKVCDFLTCVHGLGHVVPLCCTSPMVFFRYTHTHTHTHTHTLKAHYAPFLPQINFFQDHTKVIICPLMSAVSYIDEQKTFTTYKLSLIEKHGCNKELSTRCVRVCVCGGGGGGGDCMCSSIYTLLPLQAPIRKGNDRETYNSTGPCTFYSCTNCCHTHTCSCCTHNYVTVHTNFFCGIENGYQLYIPELIVLYVCVFVSCVV